MHKIEIYLENEEFGFALLGTVLRHIFGSNVGKDLTNQKCFLYLLVLFVCFWCSKKSLKFNSNEKNNSL